MLKLTKVQTDILNKIRADDALSAAFDSYDFDVIYRWSNSGKAGIGPEYSEFTDLMIKLGIDPLSYVSDFIPNCMYSGLSITNITIPSGVKTIWHQAFAKCDKLTSVTLNDGLIDIEAGVFVDCVSLASIDMPNSVVTVDEFAFENCTSLRSVTLSNSMTRIADRVFNNCALLNNVAIPSSVTVIEDESFAKCRCLDTMTYDGTVDQFKHIRKRKGWVDYTVTVHCADGDLVYER